MSTDEKRWGAGSEAGARGTTVGVTDIKTVIGQRWEVKGRETALMTSWRVMTALEGGLLHWPGVSHN